ERDEHRAEAELADALVARGVEQGAADQPADDADDDRAEASEPPAGSGERTRERAGDEPYDDPTDHAHGLTLLRLRLLGLPRAVRGQRLLPEPVEGLRVGADEAETEHVAECIEPLGAL